MYVPSISSPETTGLVITSTLGGGTRKIETIIVHTNAIICNANKKQQSHAATNVSILLKHCSMDVLNNLVLLLITETVSKSSNVS